MRRALIVIISFLCIFSLISCRKKDDEMDNTISFSDAYMSYNIQNEIYEFSVDDTGNLYYITYEAVNDTDMGTYNQKTLSICNPTGELLNKFGFEPFELTHDDKKIYGALFNDRESLELVEINMKDINSNPADVDSSEINPYETIFVTEIEGFTKLYKMEVDRDRIYTLGVHKDYVSQAESSLTNDGYNYEGQKIQWFDRNIGEWKLLDIVYPVTMSKTLDDKLLIYAYDKEQGFYFIFYDSETDTYSEPHYSEIGYVDNIEVYTEDYDIVYVNKIRNRSVLSTVNPLESKSVAELVPIGGYQFYNLKTIGDYTFYITEAGDDIIRIRNEAYLRGNKNIIALAPIFSGSNVPFGLGYSFETVKKPHYEMALEILSQNDQYDLYQLNSRDNISMNIREHGAFYPLNDVPGVKEYIDSCFPYIKDAAINQEGDIWMLPIFVDVPVYIYNSQFAETMGIQISKDMDFDDFSSMNNILKNDKKYVPLYYHIRSAIVYNVFYQYFRTYSDFNEPVFRQLAEQMASEWNYQKNETDGNMMIKSSYYSHQDRDFIFTFSPWVNVHLDYSGDNYLNAMTIPSIAENKKSVASCYFLAVNPSGKNLKETLNYISSLSKYLNNPINNEYVTLSNRENYPDSMFMDDLYEIYCNAEIAFTYDDEIYLDNFEAYLREEMDLDTFIKTSNDKLKIYLNE